MAKDDELILEIVQQKAAQEKQQEETKKEAEKPRNVEQWLGNVEMVLREVLPPHKQQQLEQIFAAAKAAEQAEASIKKVGKQVSGFFDDLKIEDIEKLLKDLKDLETSAKPSSKSAEQIVVYEKELEHVAREKEAREARGEVIKRQDLRGAGSLRREVFEDFAKFLGGKDAQIHYEGNKFEVKMTSDGTYIITVPEASFENMIQIAQAVSKDAFSDKVGVENLPDKLMDAALILERQAIFSTSAIESLYNAGYQLKRAFDKNLVDKHFSFTQIQEAAKMLFAVMSPEQRAELQKRIDDIYLGVFLGKHEVEFTQDEKGLHIKRDSRGKLYDTLFDRFTKWQTTEDGKKWLIEQGYTAKELQDPKNKERIIASYDKWLTDPAREYNLMHRLKFFIEENMAMGGRFERRYGVLLNQWRKMLSDSKGIQEVKDQLDKELGDRQLPEEQQLQRIATFFQPEGQVEKLNYLPSEVLRLFQENGHVGERNEAACIIADSYVKTILQERGFGVFTQLITTEIGGHTRLIAVSKKNGKAYYVDPNRLGVAVEQIPVGSKILEQLREEIPANEQKANGDRWQMKHGVLIQERGSVIADGNALLTSGFLTNMIDEAKDDQGKPLSDDVKFVAAQRAASLFPENPVAWLQMAKYSEGKRREEYLERAVSLGFDKTLAEKLIQNGENIRIGAWAPGPSGNADIDNLVRDANIWIAASANPTGGLEQLTSVQLRALDQSFENLMKSNATIAGDPNLLARALERQGAIESEIRDRQNRAQAAAERDAITVFQLTRGEIETLRAGDKQTIENLIEGEILKFARVLNPGSQVSPLITQQIEGRFRDMVTVLSSRSTDVLDVITGVTNAKIKGQLLEYLENMGKVLQGAPGVAARIESGDPELQKQAGQAANFMDERGGLVVLDQLFKMHEGRVGGLLSDLRQDMRRLLQRNYEHTGKFYTTHEEYKDLPRQAIERTIANARVGIGPYERFRHQDPNDPNSPLLANPADQEARIREQVTMDIKFAQLIFIITGEASAIYIRSRNPDAVRDLAAGAFLNAQWQDVKRYGLFSSANEKVSKAQRENAARIHLEEVYGGTAGREMAEGLIHDKKLQGLFDFYVEQNGIDILAPTVQMWWENRAVRTWQMIESLNEFEQEYVARVHPAWAAGYQGPTETIREKKIRKARNEEERKAAHEAYEVPIGGNPEFGIMLRAFLYHDSVSKDWEESENILKGKGADYYADVIFEPFAYQAGVDHRVNNAPADSRFMAVFGGGNAAFLDGLALPGYTRGRHISGYSTEYQQAIERFNKFQQILRPMMDAIRNNRINTTNPSQTNFAIDNSPEVNDALRVLGINADQFRGLIGAMQNQIRGDHGMAHTLVNDPMFENHWYSPMTVIDMPMWMIDGKDLAGNTNKRDFRSQMGGNNILGRYLGDVQELGWKTRAGVISFIQNQPNNVHGFLKLMEEQIAPGIAATRGPEAAHDVEFIMMTKMLLMQHPELADAFGFKDGIAGIRGKNTEYRQIYGARVAALSREEILTFAEGYIIPKLPAKLKRRMRKALKITDWDRLKRQAGQSLLIFLLSTIFATGSAVFGAVNPGEQAA